ncbi:MAG: PDZ domain-containing protein [Verrucomicrobia bacterium]|nr:PDZ domain-containing protein [Verrucomicrobiota bacterium]
MTKKRISVSVMRIGSLALALLTAFSFAAEAEQSDADILSAAISDVSSALREHGMSFDMNQITPSLVSALVKAVDPRGRILSKAEYEGLMNSLNGEAYTLGVKLSRTNGLPYVVGIMKEHEGAVTNLQAGDLIREVDGVDARELRVNEFISMIKSTNPAPVRLSIQRDAYETNEVTVARIKGAIPSIALAEDLPAGLCYLQVSGLSRNSGKDIVSTIRGWSEAGRYGLILDLRGSAGTDLDAVRDVAGLFGESGSILFTFRDKDDQEIALQKAEAGERISMPTMVLVDGNTAGAAEVLAAALRRSVSGAMLIGRESAGDMCIREPITLSSGDILYLATKKLVVADGTTYRGDSGIKPDVRVQLDAGQEEEYEPTITAPKKKNVDDDEKRQNRALKNRVKGDAAMRRAVDVLLGLKALNIRTVDSDS